MVTKTPAYDEVTDWYEAEFLELQRSGYLDAHRVAPVDPTARDVGQAGQVREKVCAAHVPLHTLLNRVVDARFMVERSAEGARPTPVTFSLRCPAR